MSQGSNGQASALLNKQQEDDLIRELQIESRSRLLEDPLRELDEALMDRSHAQKVSLPSTRHHAYET